MTEHTAHNPIGHKDLLRQLARLVERRAMPHAMLFVGPAGIGKLTVARWLARKLLVNTAPGRVEDTTENEEKLFASGNHPDLHIIRRDEERKELTVENIRAFTAQVRLKPYFGTATVCIIDNAHEMNISACNSLLLTLEEPPSHAFFVLVTDSPQRLPETILSRCQTVYFGALSPEEAAAVFDRALPETTAEIRAAALKCCTGSIAPLGFDRFVSPQTGVIGDDKAAREQLATITEESRRLRGAVNQFFKVNVDESSARAGALTLAAELSAAADTDGGERVWLLLHSAIRDHLLAAGSKQSARSGEWAQLLLESVRSEKLVRERNVNAVTQLSSLLLQMT